ncbi:MAG: putative lipid II flippase FtsW [Gracilibacteraceae bacterium]|jgi:cell division protein FtsW|nr:putative lipid II flippase FtsW [Gracilibacteraceae bacterium]
MPKEKTKQAEKPQRPDFLLAASALVILAFGLVMVLSAGARFSYQHHDNPYNFFTLQLLWAAVGFIAVFIAMYVPFHKWRRFCGAALIAVAVLLMLVNFTRLGGGNETQEVTRWLVLGRFRFQPSELAKPIMILFLAHNFDRFPVGKLRDALGPCLFAFAVILLVLTEDFGTAFVMFAAAIAMLLQTGFPWRYFIVGIPAAVFLATNHIASTQYQKDRIVGWLNPWNNISTSGYQTAWSKFSLASGGLFGLGVGRNLTSISLPDKYNDMIFSVIGQEFGFFGTLIFLLVLVFFIIRCYEASSRCPDHFGRLLGFGLTSLIAFQCAVNICSALGILPITGITLPLVSYGGTSLIVTMFEIGILLNISRYSSSRKTFFDKLSASRKKHLRAQNAAKST